MTNSQYNEKNEQDELQKYLEEKAKQEQEQEKQKEQEPEQLSAYEACVLRESARIHELIAEAQKNTNEHSEDE
ncbi:hypothetical protein [Psychrobacter sp. Rd 27.2]|uniref:hypothetical protein n=1 Tax=Psychrobacter sp. Rd 27.2 TaxID=1926479 RepID=UPI000946D450|nr:hypothetical protein [Psychrobacter sp. Rd 27.2]OLF40672.1 hypothetical protein BTV99_08020 [Psychrobacter sp. Rd 27.2]